MTEARSRASSPASLRTELKRSDALFGCREDPPNGKNYRKIITISISIGDIGKGEALVPKSIMRFDTRVDGRDGVEILKAEDKRIKYDGLHHRSSYLEHLNFLTAIKAKGQRAPAVDLQDGLVSVAIRVAAQLSIENGCFIRIEEVL